jgi:hypothetical protein
MLWRRGLLELIGQSLALIVDHLATALRICGGVPYLSADHDRRERCDRSDDEPYRHDAANREAVLPGHQAQPCSAAIRSTSVRAVSGSIPVCLT